MGGELARQAKPENAFLAEVEELTGVSSKQIEDDLLRERYKTAEAMAQALGVDVAMAKRILADPIVQENALKVFIQSAKAELDLIEIPTLLGIIKAPGEYASPDQKRRAAKELRKILEGTNRKPTFQFNQQINQNNFGPGEPGWIDQKIIERSKKNDDQ